MAVTAAQAGYSVLFDTASNWITRLAEAHRAGRLDAELKKIRRYKLITIDEVGYIPFDQDAANLFFQLSASRYEQARSWSLWWERIDEWIRQNRPVRAESSR